MMTKLSNKADLLKLTEDLKEYFPGSLHVHGIVRNSADGILDREVWVDHWPQFTAVFIKPGDDAEQHFSAESLSLYKTPDSGPSGCVSLLRDQFILDWNEPINFGIYGDVRDLLVREAENHNFRTTVLGHVDQMTATAESLVELAGGLPDGIKESSLTPEDAPYVTSRWPFAKVIEDAEHYIRFLITHFPSVALRLDNESSTLIGWALVYTHGALAMFYVEPEYRGQGLGKNITLRIASTVLEQGRPAFLYVEFDNDIARQLYLKSGFSQTNLKGLLVRCEPNS